MIQKKNTDILFYIQSLQKPLSDYCPDCHGQLIHDIKLSETYCSRCGLVVSGAYDYVAGVHILFPYGRMWKNKILCWLQGVIKMVKNSFLGHDFFTNNLNK